MQSTNIWLLQVTNFEKKRHYGKEILDVIELFTQCNIKNYCEHITAGVNLYLYECVY